MRQLLFVPAVLASSVVTERAALALRELLTRRWTVRMGDHLPGEQLVLSRIALFSATTVYPLDGDYRRYLPLLHLYWGTQRITPDNQQLYCRNLAMCIGPDPEHPRPPQAILIAANTACGHLAGLEAFASAGGTPFFNLQHVCLEELYHATDESYE
jgi:hypothetical protein